MYKIIKSVIDSKDFKLEDMLHKINKMYVEDKITELEKGELDNMARSNAKMENSYDIQRQLDKLEARVKALESQNTTEDTAEPSEEYPEFIKPSGSTDCYKIGDKITFKGKKYICKLPTCVWDPETYPPGWEEVVEEIENASVEV